MRRTCAVDGCERLGRNKGFSNGSQRYGRICETHHKQFSLNRTSSSNGIFEGKFTIPNIVCQKCGWDKAPCDRHRIDPKKGYFKENVLVLCPNCHRLEHYKKP
jgi:hypothetical protein